MLALGWRPRHCLGRNTFETFGGVVRMKSVRWFAAGAVLGLLSSASLAFQEQKGGGSSPAPADAGKAPAVELTPPASPVPAVPGTEVSLPGFGRLGFLPKFDLGLELLYGVSDSDRKPTNVERASPINTEDENLRIRGTLKHRF